MSIGDYRYEYYSKEILKDKTLSSAAKVVANHLIHISGWDKDNRLPSHNRLAETLSMDPRAVSRALSLLRMKGYISIQEDNTFTFKLCGITFSKQDLSKPEVCHMLGDFVKVPSYLNYIDTITPSARIAAIMFFDFNFGIKDGWPYVKKATPTIDGVASYYGINKSTFKSRIQKCKAAEIFEYTVVADNYGKKRKVVGLKNILWINEWRRFDHKEMHKDKEFIKREKLRYKVMTEGPSEESDEHQRAMYAYNTEHLEELKECDRLYAKLSSLFKREFDLKYRDIPAQDQLVWLRKRSR